MAAVTDLALTPDLAGFRAAAAVEGCRAIGITRGIPGLSMLGVVDDLLVDRAFVENRRESAQELASVLDDPARAEQLRIAGRERAAGFTWDRTAELTAAAYAEVAP